MIDGSMEEHLNKISDRYSSLFTLPSNRAIQKSLIMTCLMLGFLWILPFPLSFANVLSGLAMGSLLYIAALISNFIVRYAVLRNDPILNMRRCSFLSLPTCIILGVFIALANFSFALTGSLDLWVKVSSAGFFSALMFRSLISYAVSSSNYSRTFISALLQPALLFAVSLLIMYGYVFKLYHIYPFILSIFLVFISTLIFSRYIDILGRERLGVGALSLFKAFLVNWTEDINGPLEGFLEDIGEEQDVKVSLLSFLGVNGMKAVMVIPAIHPGPFKNVGSSPLPGEIHNALKSRFKCVVSVPHGISGHDLDLPSHIQNRKVLRRILELSSPNQVNPSSQASPFIRSKVDIATASCQIFGECALVTLTVSPETMEDLPRRVDQIINQEARRNGLAAALVIDSHNSIQGPFNLGRAVNSLIEAASGAIKSAVKCSVHPLEVGAAEVKPKEFTVRDGLGPGGISVILVKTGNHKVAYITIDGNNMVSGLREKILNRIKGLGVDDGEVITTDTHVVNGVVKIDRGYHPVGDIIDHEKLIKYIERAVLKALENVEPARSFWHVETIRGVKVIGGKRLSELCILTEHIIGRVKFASAVIIPVLALIFLLFLIIF